jgi:hypothetical protein
MVKRWIMGLILTAIAISLSAPPACSGGHSWLKSTRTEKYQKLGVLHMVEVTAEDGEWQLDRRDPRGVMRYWVWGTNFNFFFKGRRLLANTDYTLVYAIGNYDKGYDDAYVVLGEGSTDRRGRIYFHNSLDTCSMPFGMDARADYGAKILLLPSDHLNEGELSSPALEGTNLIRFNNTRIRFNNTRIVEPCDDSVIIIKGDETPEETPSDPIEEEMPPGFVPSGPMPPGFVPNF